MSLGSSCERDVRDDPLKAASLAFLVVENSSARIKLTLDFFPLKPWRDFEGKIENNILLLNAFFLRNINK